MFTIKPGLKQFLVRLLIFLGLFITLTAITGPWIISTRLLYGFHFFIYGNLGKMVIYSTIVFILLTKDRLARLNLFPYRKSNIWYILASFILIPLFFASGRLLLTYPQFSSNLPLSLASHLLLTSMAALLIPGVFGVEFIKYFLKNFRKEVYICLVISILYDLAIFQVWKLWPYFSNFVLNSEKLLFSLTFEHVSVIAPRILIVEKFAVSIAEACSGLDSLFLFSSLYILIAIQDFKIFNKLKLILMFIPASLGLIAVNIIRVYLLILIGVVISPDLALKLFHTYAGMILFIIY